MSDELENPKAEKCSRRGCDEDAVVGVATAIVKEPFCATHMIERLEERLADQGAQWETYEYE